VASRLGLLLIALWSTLQLACGDTVRPLQDPQPAAPTQVQVLVVPLTGVLGTKEIALCHRALREGAAHGFQVVFQLFDAGGDAESATDIQGLLDQVERVRSKVATTAVVRGKALGGAAYLALLCDQLWFLRDGSVGPITPMPTFLEQLQEYADDSAERRRLRAFADEMRQRLQQRRNKLPSDAVRLCEGMVDPGLKLVRVRLRERGVESQRVVDATELTGLQAAGATILDQTEVTRPVELTRNEAIEVRLAQGTVQSMEHLCSDVLGIDPRQAGELQFSWAERMVDWLELFQPALLLLGLVLLILEVKTPGVGLPGLLGAGFLALALFYNYLVGLAEVTEILLFVLGLAALAVEIFLLPGMVVFGATGFLCLVFSLILSRQTFVLPSTVAQDEILFHNLLQLTGMFIAVLVFAAVLWRIMPRVPLLNRLYLPAPEPAPGTTSTVPQDRAESLRALVGNVGRAATVLRPAGAVDLGGERYDVVTNGEFVEAGASVRVVEVIGSRIVVERAEADSQRGSVGLILLIGILGIVLLVAEVFFVSFGVL
jgi:membrane-bound serine protease (ClpP class)